MANIILPVPVEEAVTQSKVIFTFEAMGNTEADEVFIQGQIWPRCEWQVWPGSDL